MIELKSEEKVFFINPAQITHVEGHEDEEGGGGAVINISLNAIDSSGRSVILTFRNDDATRLFSALRSLSP